MQWRLQNNMILTTSTKLMATSVVTETSLARTPNYCAQHEVERSQQIAIDFLPTTLLHLKTRSSYHKLHGFHLSYKLQPYFHFSKRTQPLWAFRGYVKVQAAVQLQTKLLLGIEQD